MFYGNIDGYSASNQAAFAPFDAAAAAAEMDTEVLIPIDGYRRLFQRAGLLTRLATFISPDEMDSDPVFIASASLPDVAPQRMAVARVVCGDGMNPCDAPVRLSWKTARRWAFTRRRACNTSAASSI